MKKTSENTTFKIQKLKEICSILHKNKISFTLGGSGLLYFLGVVKNFNDWDLVLYCSEKDMQNVFSGLDLKERTRTSPYLSTYFYTLYTETVSFDLMGYFGVEQNNEQFKIQNSVYKFEDSIPLGSPQDWEKAYFMMGRPEKSALLKNYISQDILK